METQLKINGRIPSKKNSRRPFIRNGRIMNFPSKKYKEWNEKALWELKSQKPPKSITRAEIDLFFRMPDNRKTDLTNKAESVMDTLVDAGILEDDCWQVVTPITMHGHINRKNPGVDIILRYDVDKST